MNKFNYVVSENDVKNELPIKELLRCNFKFSSRLNKKIKRESLILLNGIPVKTFIIPQLGDIISVRLPEEASDFTPENIPVDILYEDDDLLIINKQPGIVVHPTKGHPAHTLANGIMKHIIDTNQNFKIRFINRLDMDTSGVLTVGKNSHAQDDYTKQMADGNVKKKYTAVVKGILENDYGTIDLPIGRPDVEKVERCVMENGGSPSITHYKVMERYTKGYTLVELLLETGRTHQIRVHMSHIGHPVVGDHLYGGSNPFLIERQALHSTSISFYHPVNRNLLDVASPLPDDMIFLINKIK